MRNALVAIVGAVLVARIFSGAEAQSAKAAQASGPRPVRVTLHEGTNIAAALSPDGRTIAMDLQGTLWTLPANGGDAKAITDIFMDARQPAWSPDGKKIAFQAYRTTTWQIWTINADGTDPRPLTSSAFDDREPVWSPDGRMIAFSSDRSGSYDIWVVNVANGDVRQVTNAPSNEFMPTWFDGSQIAYVSDRRDMPGIYVGEKLMFGADGALAAPAFSAGDNRRTVFNQVVGTRSRLVMWDGSVGRDHSPRNIADPDEDVFPFRPQFMPNGDVLYTADGKIKRRPAAGGPAQTIEFNADISFTRPAFTPKRHQFEYVGPQRARGIMHPVISPDGTQIAFAALGDLWTMPAGGGTPRRLTMDSAVQTEPMFSPDGTALAYASDRGGSMQIWIRDLASGVDRQLTKSTSAATQPSWSPDGSRIAFLNSDGEIHVVDVASGATKRIHDHLNEPGRAAWAPDGSAVVVSALKVYSTRFREGDNKVLRVSVNGEPDRWFDPAPHKSIGMREDYGPAWSRDGKQMAAIVDGLLAVWPVGPDGTPMSAPRAISTELAGSPSWTADGRFVLYQSDAALKLVDVSARRVVREISVNITWSLTKQSDFKVIHAGRMWDGRTDAAQTDMDIVVRGNRIASIEKHRAELHKDSVIDASNQTVIPGLIEIHSHLSENFGEALGKMWLAWGITTVRNPATNTFETMENRESFESGARVGPRLITTGEPFDGTRIYYPGGTSLDDSGQLPMELQHAKDFGYDFIKTYVRLPDLMQKRIVDAAHAMGMPVTSHELYPAVAFGVDGVEHIRGTSRRGYSPKISLLSRSYQDVIQLLTASKMTITPTIGIQGGFRLQTLQDASWTNDERIRKLYPASVWQRTIEQMRTPASAETLADARRAVEPQERTIFQIVRGGGRVVAGTDAPINPYGLSLLMEMENYAEAGLTPLEVLRTATTVSAEAMGTLADIGSIEPGKLADISFIDGDPLATIKDLKKVSRVMKNGVVYDRATLLR